MDFENVMISEMNSIKSADNAKKVEEDERIGNLMNKCDEIVENISFLKKYGFSFKIAEKDSYGRRKPRVYLYHNNNYFCFLEASLGDRYDFKGNDLFRFLHPCVGGTYETIAKVIGQILMGK